ncbi:MAG TPA: thioesterase family protein [Nocardioides sp.]
MRHLYACQIRWADLDMLGHVNNVTYVDYIQEARADMFRTHAPDRKDALVEGALIIRNSVTYAAPLGLRDSVAIEIWVTEIRAASFTVAYEVFDIDEAGERVVFLRASSVTAPFVFADGRPRRLTEAEVEVLEKFLEPEATAPPVRFTTPAPERTHLWEANVRFTDVDAYQHVNNVTYFEYFQEARISAFRRMFAEVAPDEGLSVVVAQMDVDYKRPIAMRQEPYDVRSWISRVGGSSYDVCAEIVDGGTVLARSRATLVTFDAATQRAAQPSDAYRKVLLEHLVA